MILIAARVSDFGKPPELGKLQLILQPLAILGATHAALNDE